MLTKTQQILAYLAKNHHKPSITVLIKLAYLTDLLNIKKYGNQLTDFEYIRYYYGPYDKKIKKDLEVLIEGKIIAPTLDYTPNGNEYEFFVYNEQNEPDYTDITDQDKDIIDTLLQQLNGYGAKALTEVAYKTKPMLKIDATLGSTDHLNELLDMHAE